MAEMQAMMQAAIKAANTFVQAKAAAIEIKASARQRNAVDSMGPKQVDHH